MADGSQPLVVTTRIDQEQKVLCTTFEGCGRSHVYAFTRLRIVKNGK